MNEKSEIYQMFIDGRTNRARARDLLGDDWEEVAQKQSMRRARESNQENGYSGEELTEMFA